MKYHLSVKSNNKKTGPIPVSTSSRETCPDSCTWKNNGCYAELGPLKLHWQKVSDGSRGVCWGKFLEQIDSLVSGQIWRHNQAGDLSGPNDTINAEQLKQLVQVNKGKKGFTYTHKKVGENDPLALSNRETIKYANDNGFTINLSGNGPEHADKLLKLGIGPVTTVLSSTTSEKSFYTKEGNKVVVCPAAYSEDISCADCQICTHTNRKSIVGFPAHGSQKYKLDDRLGFHDNG